MVLNIKNLSFHLVFSIVFEHSYFRRFIINLHIPFNNQPLRYVKA